MAALRNALALLLVVLSALFVALNWTALSAVQEISLGVRTVPVPLGLAMIVIVGLFGVLFLLYALGMRASSLVESRRLGRELEAARKVADEAEASRLADLRALLETRLDEIHDLVSSEAAQTRERVEQAETELQAYLGEIDDFLKRPEDGDEPAPGTD